MMIRFGYCLLCTTVISSLFPALSRAQQIDYGGLEQMFGEPVTTSATGSPQKASQAPADMQIITPDEIRRSGATDIPDILRFVAGVDVRSYGAVDNDVSIRGFSQPWNPRLLVLINGRQVYFDDYGYVAWQNLPVQLNDIRQIEVVKGPASALFGFNAASGVINIITYDPLSDRTDVATATIGTDGTIAGSVVTTLQDPGKGGVTISLGGLRTRDYSLDALPRSTVPFYTTPHQGSYDIDGRYKPTSNTEVTIDVTQSQSENENYNAAYTYTPLALRSSSIKSSAAIDSSAGLITVLGYINQTKTNIYAATSNEDWSNQADVLQANDLFKIGDSSTIRVAAEYRNNRAFGQIYDHVFGYQDYAASAMWNWQINAELAFTAAGRMDRMVLEKSDPLTPSDKYTASQFQGKARTTPTYNLGLVYQATQYDTVRWLVGRAVQAPSLVDFGLDVQLRRGPIGIIYAGTPDLKPAVSTNYEIDYDKVLPALDSTLRTAIYYNSTQDIVTNAASNQAAFANGLLQDYAANTGSGQALGGEVGLEGSNPSGLRWSAAYSLMAVRDHMSSGPPVTALQYNASTPLSMVDLSLGYSWNKFEADIQGKWQSRFTDYAYAVTARGAVYNSVYVSNFFTVNARLGYQLTPKLTLAISGQQLQSQQTIETAGLQPERRILFSATYGF